MSAAFLCACLQAPWLAWSGLPSPDYVLDKNGVVELTVNLNPNQHSSSESIKVHGLLWQLQARPYNNGAHQVALFAESQPKLTQFVSKKQSGRLKELAGKTFSFHNAIFQIQPEFIIQGKKASRRLSARIEVNRLVPRTFLREKQSLLANLKNSPFERYRSSLEWLHRQVPHDPELVNAIWAHEKCFLWEGHPFHVSRSGPPLSLISFPLLIRVPNGLKTADLGSRFLPFSEEQDHTYRIEVFYRIGKEATAVPLVLTDRKGYRLEKVLRFHPVQNRSKWALIVYLDYQQSPLKPLQTEQDKQTIHELCINDPGFSETRIMVLKNPDYRRLLAEGRSFLRQANPDDLILFYFAGHGYRRFDGEITRYGLYLDRELELDELFRVFNDLGKQNHVFIFDACYSGGFTDSLANPYANASHPLPILDRSLIISAATYFQPAWEQAEQGAFTRTFQQRIKQLGTHRITVANLVDLFQNLPITTAGKTQKVTLHNRLFNELEIFNLGTKGEQP